MSENKEKYPVITIQSDWNDGLRVNKGKVWISSKYSGEISTHGHLTSSLSVDNKIKIAVTEEYIFINLITNSLVVKHELSGLIVAFVAPMKSYKVHKKAVHSVAASENALVVSSCEDDKLLVWDSRTGPDTLVELKGHGGPVYRCRFFPSGAVVLSAGADGSLRVWDAESGACPVTLKSHTMAVADFVIVERGRNIISVSKDGKAKLWDIGKANCLADLVSADGPINCCALAAGNETHEVQNDREVGTEDKLLLIGCENGCVIGTKVAVRQNIFKQKFDAAVNCCEIIGDKIVLGCADGKLICLLLKDGSVVTKIHESASPVLSITTLKPSEQMFIAGRQDGTCTCYSLQASHKDIRVQLTGSDCDGIRDLFYNGKWVFAASRDCTIRKYDVNQLSVHFKV